MICVKVMRTSDLSQQHRSNPRERDMPKGNGQRANHHALGKNSNQPGFDYSLPRHTVMFGTVYTAKTNI